MKREIKAIIFDYGCVISADQNSKSVQEMCKRLKLSPQEFRKSYMKFRSDYDAASVTAEEYWQNICYDCNVVYSKNMIDGLIRLDIKSWTFINKETRDFIIGLKRYKVKKAVISNITKDVLEYIHKKHGWFNIFNATVYSCDLNKCKPEKILYYKCLELLQLNADECLYIDDSYENVKSAEEIGMHTIQFKDNMQFKKDIDNDYTFV